MAILTIEQLWIYNGDAIRVHIADTPAVKAQPIGTVDVIFRDLMLKEHKITVPKNAMVIELFREYARVIEMKIDGLAFSLIKTKGKTVVLNDEFHHSILHGVRYELALVAEAPVS